jgi:alpha-amylase
VGVANADNDVMLQGFYWDNPGGWFKSLREQIPELKAAGITAIWLPPPTKCDGGASSNGYDPFDHYDLGEFDQRGTVGTHFGTKQDLMDLVAALHQAGIAAYADVVLNHMMGAVQEDNPLTQQKTWTKFTYQHPAPAGAPAWPDVERLLGRSIPHGPDEPYLFNKTWMDFHRSTEHNDEDGERHAAAFGSDICQAHDYAGGGLKLWGDWLTRTVGYDGYRVDFAKGLDEGFLNGFLNFGAMKGKFAVREYWEGDVNNLDGWYNEVDTASVFDFPLFFRALNPMCNDTSGNNFKMSWLDGAGYGAKNPFRTVTFAENHDTDRSNPITNDKIMAYAFILSMEGYPCLFYKDLYVYGMKDKIFELVDVRRRFAAGKTSTLWKDDHLFIAQRNGNGGQIDGLVVAINNSPTDTLGQWVSVKSEWANKVLKIYSFSGKVDGGNQDKFTGETSDVTVQADGRVRFWAPPRGYAIYAFDIGHELTGINDQITALQNGPQTPETQKQLEALIRKRDVLTAQVAAGFHPRKDGPVTGMPDGFDHAAVIQNPEWDSPAMATPGRPSPRPDLAPSTTTPGFLGPLDRH